MSTAAEPKCKRDRCFVPERECAYGELEYWKSCPHFKSESEVEAPPKQPEGATDFPWTGNTFGLDDASWLAARGRPRLLAPVGPHNAGKTTFLVSLYLGMCRGLGVSGEPFAGSFTLGGWENLAAHLRYKPDGIGPAFPPHTVARVKSAPGLLHLATRRADSRIHDLLLADAPGEWFRSWSINQGHDSAIGARWVAKHADAFLLFVDCDALSGPARGVARDDLFKLALRLGAHLNSRPVAIVWAKADKTIPSTLKQQLDERLKHHFPTARNFSVSAVSPSANGDPGSQFLEVVSWLMAQRKAAALDFAIPTNKPDDPFLAYRGSAL